MDCFILCFPELFDQIVSNLNFFDMAVLYHTSKNTRIKRRHIIEKSEFLIRAARMGYYNLAVWGFDNGCRTKTSFCSEAARIGRLDLVQLAVSRGVNCNSWACHNAAEYGSLNILKFAEKHGGTCTDVTAIKAAKGGHLHILRYLYKSGCQITPEVEREAKCYKHKDIIEWLIPFRFDYYGVQLDHNKLSPGIFLESHKPRDENKKRTMLVELRRLIDRGEKPTIAEFEFISKSGDKELIKYFRENGYPYLVDYDEC